MLYLDAEYPFKKREDWLNLGNYQSKFIYDYLLMNINAFNESKTYLKQSVHSSYD